MRILFVAPYIPSKIRIRPYHFMKGLRKRGHSIHFIGLAGSYANQEVINELKEYCDTLEIFRIPKARSYLQCIINLLGRMPLQAAHSHSREMERRIKQITLHQSFDVIHVEHIRAGYLLPGDSHIPAIYDSVDCITSLCRSFGTNQSSPLVKLILSIESKKLEKSEPLILSRYNTAIVSASRDKRSLEDLARKAKCFIPEIHVIENGVDAEYFKPSHVAYEPYSIVFTGKMGYYANELAALHFAKEIFPLIKSRIPQAKFYIVGAKPSKRIEALQRIDEHIVVTGWVPDIRKYLAVAHAVVCPVQVTAGIQNKLLEAMAMGKPVVTYPEAGLPLEPDNRRVFLVANTPKSFAENILNLMNNESLRSALGKNARDHIKRFYSWNEKVETLEKTYIKTIETYTQHQAS